MELVQRSNDAATLWRALLPQITAPEFRQFIVWARRFTDPVIERALWRTSKKFAETKSQTDAVTVHRYVTGLLLNLENEGKGTSEQEEV